MSTPPNNPSDSTTPTPEDNGDQKQRQAPLGPQGKAKVGQLRDRSGIVAVVLAVVTIATIVFAFWNLADRFSKWDPTGWIFTIAVALVGTVIVLLLIWWIPKHQVDRHRARLKPKDQVELEIQARSTLIQIIGGVALLVSIFFTAKNLEITAQNVKSTEDNLKYARSTQIAERYAKAIEQLKNKDDPGVRLAGIYTLGIIAEQHEARDFYAPIMLVLAADVRNRSALAKNYDSDSLDPIPPDIQAILAVIGKQKHPALKLNLNGTNLMNADLQGGHFENVDFSGCYLAGARLDRAQLDSVNLANANLSGAYFDGANMELANLQNATLFGTSLQGTNLRGSSFKLAKVQDAIFDKAQLTNTDFHYATGNGGYFNDVDLQGSSGVNPAWIKKPTTVD